MFRDYGTPPYSWFFVFVVCWGLGNRTWNFRICGISIFRRLLQGLLWFFRLRSSIYDSDMQPEVAVPECEIQEDPGRGELFLKNGEPGVGRGLVGGQVEMVV